MAKPKTAAIVVMFIKPSLRYAIAINISQDIHSKIAQKPTIQPGTKV